MRLGKRNGAQNGRQTRVARAAKDALPKASHPAVARLAAALQESKQASEQQAATAEILRAMSRSTRDAQPVLDAIVRNAHRLCGALYTVLHGYDGKLITLLAAKHVDAKAIRVLRETYPEPAKADKYVGRAIIERRTVHSADIPNDPRFPGNRNKYSKVWPRRAGIAVPLIRDGVVVGAIACGRLEPKPFSKKEIALLQTFADQAAIAMENVRLFKETSETLERQTATAEILKVIARSPSDVQPVFDTIVRSAVQLCGGLFGSVYRFDGEKLHFAAHHNFPRAALEIAKRTYPRVPDRSHGAGRAILTKSVARIEDIYRDPDYYRAYGKKGGWRRVLAVPMMLGDVPLGTISVAWADPGPIPDSQVELLKTFADQAVIAIENARLFNETKEALEHQKTSADILKIVASSVADTEPVFTAITEAGSRLVPGCRFALQLARGGHLHYTSHSGVDGVPRAKMARFFPIPVKGGPTPATKAIDEKRLVHVADIEQAGKQLALGKQLAKAAGWRAIVAVPLMRGGDAIGTITITRREPGSFSEKQIALLQTFAGQAVIALENAKMFREVQDRNAELKQSLDFQSASGEILSSISSSITDAQPVFDAIVTSLLRLFGTKFATVALLRDGELHLAALRGEKGYEWLKTTYPQPPRDWNLTGRAVLSGKVQQVTPCIGNPATPPRTAEVAAKVGFNSIIAAPMIREGKVVGAITTGRRDPVPFDDKQVALIKAFADQAVIAIENARLFNETKEALARQTSTAEILRVISTSPAEVQPVFDAVAQRAATLSGVKHSSVFLADGAVLRRVATSGVFSGSHEIPIARTVVNGRAFIDGRAVHVPDILSVLDSEYPDARDNQRRLGFRSILAVPMLREGKPIGTINCWRPEVRPFSSEEIALLQTFADQAVIAIENARLFNETKEALEQQTAISEVLRVISDSPTDVNPVLEAVAARAARICDATDARIFLAAGSELHHAAGFGDVPVRTDAFPLNRGSASGRAIIDRAPVQIADIQAEAAEFPVAQEIAERSGYRTVLAVPLLREGGALGAIGLRRKDVRPFTEKQIALLKTFADQAAIAIENVRLFNETKEALERQTATAEILKVISASPTDVQPVFDAIVDSAARLFGRKSRIRIAEGDVLRLRARSDHPTEVDPADAPIAINTDTTGGRVALGRTALQIGDTEALDAPPLARRYGEKGGYRAIAAAPLLREGAVVGVISVTSPQPGGLSEKEMALLQTFADQAVIAIENVRLFNETKEALEQQTATAEILGVISSTPTDTQPVFDAIARSALRIFDGMNVSVGVVEGDVIRIRAGTLSSARKAGVAPTFALDGETIAGRAILERRSFNIADIESPDTPPVTRERARASGWRSIAIAPMLREGVAIGHIAIHRAQPVALDEKQFALLRTFAAQAVIAIENVRLFKELQERTEALSKSVGQLTALGEVGQAISSTLDLEKVLKTIVAHAVKLTGLDVGAIYEYDERAEEFHLRAAENMNEENIELLRQRPIKRGDGAVGGTAVTREPVQVADIQDESYKGRFREMLLRSGRRSLLAVPLMREDHIIGALAVQRNTPGPFAPEVVELLKTFATQSAMAIQNARLFREIAEKGRQLEVASRHKSDFLASMSHELRTPLNALLGFNEMLLGDVYGEVPGDMKPPLSQMQSSGKHLLRLINNVLDLAKIEAGRMELALSDYSVQDTVESVRSTLHPLAADKGLEFRAAVQADIPLAHGDPGRITQCLMNLAGNSLKFTRAGKVEISVALDNGNLRYSVADTGIGIPPDKMQSLFTEFKQTDATIASEYGGTGLGLSISKKFVEMHGGRIWAESEPGRGSAFHFEIPLRVAG